jgi:hypothetical protein
LGRPRHVATQTLTGLIELPQAPAEHQSQNHRPTE